MDLSIVIPSLNEEANIAEIVPRLREIIPQICSQYEIIVVDGGSVDGTTTMARELGVKVLTKENDGYGGVLKEGLCAAQGDYILTMDADISHDPGFIPLMWRERKQAEVVIASRYVDGGSADMPWGRRLLSVILNKVFGFVLSLPVKDISSGFRLYSAPSLRPTLLEAVNFDVLPEILVRCLAEGWRIAEIPFSYRRRKGGRSHARILEFGISYLKTLVKIWPVRNSIFSADYDERAYDSRLLPQRYWQRRKRDIVTGLAEGSQRSLDVGCGSSRILDGLPNPIGLDITMNKLRYIRARGKPVIQASIYDLPFQDGSFDCVVCSEVIEHLPADYRPFYEMSRVLKRGGRLIVGTPDYAKLLWRIIEQLYRILVPVGYADEHVTHYTRESLVRLLEGCGFAFQKARFILNCDMFLSFTKVEEKMAIGQRALQ